MTINRYRFTLVNPKTGHNLNYICFGRTWKEAKTDLEKDFPGAKVLSCVRLMPDSSTAQETILMQSADH